MTVPIISDSHGYGRRVEAVLDKLEIIGERAKELIFLGDGTGEFLRRVPEDVRVYAVCGNCDSFGGATGLSMIDGCGEPVPDERIEIFGGVRVLMIHGHRYYVKNGMSLAVERAVALDADILMFGHTHMQINKMLPAGSEEYGVRVNKRLHLFNPGALIDGSFGLLTLRGGEILLSHGRV